MEDEVLSLHFPKIAANTLTIVTALLGLAMRSPAAEHGAPAAPAPAPAPALAPSAPAAVRELSAAPGTRSPCASGMVLVDGDYCPEPEQVCLKWLDPPPYDNLRCGEFKKPASCKVPRVHRRYCVDRDEYAEPAASVAEALPLVNKTWTEAKGLCEQRGARLCKESEWEFACEGEAMLPYPYGFSREAGMCNIDRTDLGGAGDKLTDHRASAGSFPGCTSPFGAHHMTGNVDEWAEREGATAPHRSALRGGWWLPGRNRCRAATLHHDENYGAKQVGFRCCADAG
ncbi:MAG: putative signal transduction protein with Nacht domain protein [Labilithrix sp.]|nr:putative signal transduction protein with Nacht domain protein [Labilithrix sp.]